MLGQTLNDGSHGVALVGGEQAAHILEDEQGGSLGHLSDAVEDVMDQPPFVVGAAVATGERYGLTREPGGDDVHGRQVWPVDRLQVADVGDRGQVVREDFRGSRGGVGDPFEAGAEDVFNREVESAVSGAQTAETWWRVAWLLVWLCRHWGLSLDTGNVRVRGTWSPSPNVRRQEIEDGGFGEACIEGEWYASGGVLASRENTPSTGMVQSIGASQDAAQVSGPTIPSTMSPFSSWNARHTAWD